MNASRVLLFNPIRAREGELEATMVAREALVDELERAILADASGPSVRHWLLVAPRGSGKSHLTEVLARRIRKQTGWAVVRLPEEAYRVSSLADLLAWIVGTLEGVDRPFAATTDPARIEALAEVRIRNWRAERGPVLVILENLGELLGRRFDRKGQARLRAILMGDPPFTLVATSTRLFGDVRDHDAPFYDFFQERRLDELTSAEVLDLVVKRARYDEAADILDHLDDVRPRVAALYHLSGGNPRLVLALYGVLREGLTTELYEQLMKLLDDVTPYYQSRLNDASPQGSRVLAEMAMAEGPLVPSEIGRRCGLRTNQVTAVLAQLEEERFVRPGGRPVDKRARYWEVTDRLFRIWLQMREDGDSRGTVRWIVEFYRRWYEGDADGLVNDGSRFLEGAWGRGVEGFEDADRTIRHMLASVPDTERDALSFLVSLRSVPREDGLVRESELRDAYELGSPERRLSLTVPLAYCALRRGDPEDAERMFALAISARQPRALLMATALLAARGDGALALERIERVAREGSAPLECAIARVQVLASLGRLKELAAAAAQTELEPRAEAVLVFWTVQLLVFAGRADLAVPLLELADRLGLEFTDDLGPNAVLARYSAGGPLSDAELDQVRAWVTPRMGEAGIRDSMLGGVQRWIDRAADDPEAARLDRGLPEDEVLGRAVARLLRVAKARARKWACDPTAPAPLVPAAVLAEWATLADPAMLSELGLKRGNLLRVYTGLRDLHLLPADLPPWSDAARVAEAPDRDAALSALHPEFREAVLLILESGS